MSTKSILLLVILQTLFFSVISSSESPLKVRLPTVNQASVNRASLNGDAYICNPTYLSLTNVLTSCKDTNACTCADGTGVTTTCKSGNSLTNGQVLVKECQPCWQGHFSIAPAIKCSPCGPYQTSGTGASACSSCQDPHGKICNAASGNILLCQPSYGFSYLPFPIQCQLCLPGANNPGEQYSICELCAAGQIRTRIGTVPCVSCGQRQYTGKQEDKCLNCPDKFATRCDPMTGISTTCIVTYVLNLNASPHVCQPGNAALKKLVH